MYLSCFTADVDCGQKLWSNQVEPSAPWAEMSPVQDFHLTEEYWQGSWSDSNLDQVSLFGSSTSQIRISWSSASMRQSVPEDEQILLICDTGGGSDLHISPALFGGQRSTIHLEALPDASFMLDQEPHASMSRLWQGFKFSWHGPRGSPARTWLPPTPQIPGEERRGEPGRIPWASRRGGVQVSRVEERVVFKVHHLSLLPPIYYLKKETRNDQDSKRTLGLWNVVEVFETFRLRDRKPWDVIGIVPTNSSEGVFTYELEGEIFWWRWSKGVALLNVKQFDKLHTFFRRPLKIESFWRFFFVGRGWEM